MLIKVLHTFTHLILIHVFRCDHRLSKSSHSRFLWFRRKKFNIFFFYNTKVRSREISLRFDRRPIFSHKSFCVFEFIDHQIFRLNTRKFQLIPLFERLIFLVTHPQCIVNDLAIRNLPVYDLQFLLIVQSFVSQTFLILRDLCCSTQDFFAH